MVIDHERLEEIIDNWMDTDESGYTLADRIEEFIQEYIKEFIGGIRIFGTDEVAVEHLKKSGWLDRHDAEIQKQGSDHWVDFINEIMKNRDKSVSVHLSIDPWGGWEEK